MSQRSGKRNRRKAKVDCQVGRHRFGSLQTVGGGIVRRVCTACSSITIDLTGVQEQITSAELFVGRRQLSS
jgi:hypothetical protein